MMAAGLIAAMLAPLRVERVQLDHATVRARAARAMRAQLVRSRSADVRAPPREVRH